MPGPRIVQGDRVSLRTLETDDAPFIQRAYANTEIRTPLGSPTPKSQAAMESAIEDWNESDSELFFVVTLDEEAAGPGRPDDGDVTSIGSINVAGFDWKRPDLAYWIVPEYQRQGYATEALTLTIDYVFRTMDVPAVEAGVYEFNEASQALLESLGFREEGRFRKRRFIDGRYVDSVEYGLLRSEWEDEREA